MGRLYSGQCIKCGFEFDVKNGGGFVVNQLRCEACGREKLVGRDETEGRGEAFADEVIEARRKLGTEKEAGQCKCGGHYKSDAPARCPKCKSTEIKDTGKNEIMYD